MAIDRTVLGDKQAIIDNRNDRDDWLSKINDIADMSFDDLDTYIEENVTDLASAKVFLKKISKVLLGALKIIKKIHFEGGF